MNSVCLDRQHELCGRSVEARYCYCGPYWVDRLRLPDIVEYPDLLVSFSAVSHWLLRIGSMISFARAFAVEITLVRKER